MGQYIDFRSITARKVVNLMARGAERTFLTLSSHPKLRNLWYFRRFRNEASTWVYYTRMHVSQYWLAAYYVYNTFGVGWLSCLSQATGNAKALNEDKRESSPRLFCVPMLEWLYN